MYEVYERLHVNVKVGPQLFCFRATFILIADIFVEACRNHATVEIYPWNQVYIRVE